MEKKWEKKENPVEVKMYKEWSRKVRTKTQKVSSAFFSVR